jgi:hypothetical protein
VQSFEFEPQSHQKRGGKKEEKGDDSELKTFSV